MKILPADFDGQSIRRVYDEDTEIWWFSVIDVVQVLTESTYANRYWSDLKRKLAQEAGSEQAYEKIVRLKLTAPDGKQRDTDCAEAATLLRIVQSIPSPKAEPIKLWLAKVGYERMQEMADPALSLDRARQTWQQHGRSDKWIQQRMTGQETRNKLTDYWADHDIKKGSEFAILRGRTDFYGTGRAAHPADCRKLGRYRHAAKQDGGEGRWPHRPTGAQSVGKPDRQVGGVRCQLPPVG